MFVSLCLLCRTCFATLAVSEDAVLRFLYEMVEEMKNIGYREYRSDWLYRFQKFVMAAEHVHLRVATPSFTNHTILDSANLTSALQLLHGIVKAMGCIC